MNINNDLNPKSRVTILPPHSKHYQYKTFHILVETNNLHIIMNRIILLLAITISSISCTQPKTNINEEELIFNVRKYIISEDVLGGIETTSNIDFQLDSITEYPKYKHLEENIKLTNIIIEQVRKEKVDNLTDYRKQYYNDEIDSLKQLYNQTKKSELYFNAFFSLKGEKYISLVKFVLDENHKPIDSDLLDWNEIQ